MECCLLNRTIRRFRQKRPSCPPALSLSARCLQATLLQGEGDRRPGGRGPGMSAREQNPQLSDSEDSEEKKQPAPAQALSQSGRTHDSRKPIEFERRLSPEKWANVIAFLPKDVRATRGEQCDNVTKKSPWRGAQRRQIGKAPTAIGRG